VPYVIPGRRPVAEAVRAGRALHELLVTRDDAGLGTLVALAREQGVAVRVVSRAELDVVTDGAVHQGVAALGEPPTAAPISALTDATLVVAVDGITDPQNLGAIARSAEACGAAGLVVPKRRSAPVTPAVEKAAAGALSWLPIVPVTNLVRALGQLADLGLWSVGLDGDAPETLWASPLLDGRVVLVIGAEGAGLSRLVRERVDGLVRIPLRGRVGSLNASAAAAVALAEVVRRRTVP
jgi:23S rRNA (guanosine2251-2'-O)-methyltransferase